MFDPARRLFYSEEISNVAFWFSEKQLFDFHNIFYNIWVFFGKGVAKRERENQGGYV